MKTLGTRRSQALILAATGLAAGATPALAANRTWDSGGGAYEWTTAANWSNDRAPTSDDVAIFVDTPFNTLSASGLTITISGSGIARLVRFGDSGNALGKDITLTGGNLTIQTANGNAIALVAGNTASHVIQSNLTLQVDTTSRTADFAVNTALRIDGTISGTYANTSLQKNGAGTLTLNGNTSFTGNTIIGGGTLLLNSVSSSAEVVVQASTVAAGPLLGGSGTIAGNLAVLSGGWVAPGVAGVGELTINGTTTLDGTLVIERDDSTGAADSLDTVGLVIGATAKLDLTAVSPLANEYVIATYSSLTGEFAASNITGMQSYQFIDYNYNGNQIAVVPEPPAFAWLMPMTTVLFRRRRRS